MPVAIVLCVPLRFAGVSLRADLIEASGMRMFCELNVMMRFVSSMMYLRVV